MEQTKLMDKSRNEYRGDDKSLKICPLRGICRPINRRLYCTTKAELGNQRQLINLASQSLDLVSLRVKPHLDNVEHLFLTPVMPGGLVAPSQFYTWFEDCSEMINCIISVQSPSMLNAAGPNWSRCRVILVLYGDGLAWGARVCDQRLVVVYQVEFWMNVI